MGTGTLEVMKTRTFVGVAVILAIAGYLIYSSRSIRYKEKPLVESPKPSSSCQMTATPQLTEGPYYKTGSPLRTNLPEEGISGEKITLSGVVFDTDCQAVSGAWIDFWQANGEGMYDNIGYKLRGHQFTGSDGKYVLETVIPGVYSGRTPHIHVKLRASEKSPIITTQLFMPNEPKNQQDRIFHPNLIMDVKDSPDSKIAIFNFVIER